MKHWLETKSGKAFDLESLDPDYALDDLLWGCARQPRYGGQWRTMVNWYSVAEHSVHVGRAATLVAARTFTNPDDAARFIRTAYCHDLPEGILGDIPTPLKRLLPQYEAIEDRVYSALARRYDLLDPLPMALKEIDMRIILDETEQVLNRRDRADWNLPQDLQPLGVNLAMWPPSMAFNQFRVALEDLGIIA